MLLVSISEMFEAEKPEVTTRTLNGTMALVTDTGSSKGRDVRDLGVEVATGLGNDCGLSDELDVHAEDES